MVGGGVRGKDAGTAHGTIDQVGDTMRVFHLSTEGSLQGGDKNIENIVGKDENGIINEYPMRNFIRFIKGIFVRNLDMEDLKGEGKWYLGKGEIGGRRLGKCCLKLILP
jgi:hypothetical protein